MVKAEVANGSAFGSMVLIWGATFFAIRISNVEGYDPFRSALLRLVLAALILLTLAKVRNCAWPRGRALAATLVSGGLIFGANFGLLYWGETSVNSGTAAVLWGVYPTLVALAAARGLRGQEPLTLRVLAGGGLALLGLLVVFWSQLQLDAPALGLLAILGGISATAVAAITTKRWTQEVPILVFNGLGSVVGAALILPVALFAGRGSYQPPTPAAGAALVFLLLAGSLLAFPLWAWLLKRWSATRLSYQTVLSPLIAVALGWAVLGEPLESQFLLGAALVLGGTWIATRAR